MWKVYNLHLMQVCISKCAQLLKRVHQNSSLKPESNTFQFQSRKSKLALELMAEDFPHFSPSTVSSFAGGRVFRWVSPVTPAVGQKQQLQFYCCDSTTETSRSIFFFSSCTFSIRSRKCRWWFSVRPMAVVSSYRWNCRTRQRVL